MTCSLRNKILTAGLLALLALFRISPSEARIDGITGNVFMLMAEKGYISTADGFSVPIWGYAPAGGMVQYPGPTLIVGVNQEVTITLTNNLEANTSIVIPGQRVTATGGVPGLLGQEAPPGGLVTYTFTPTQPGTYTYYSGTEPDLQVEMGLVGALIVRPAGFDLNTPANRTAYGTADSYFDREYLLLLSEMDFRLHQLVDQGRLNEVDTTTFWAVYWFINGRTGPDTMDMAGMDAPWFPAQPYNCMPRMHPGETVLLRFIGAGRDLHPLHTHGQHVRVIARDGRLLESVPGSGTADLSPQEFTVTVAPGQTIDALYRWTGQDMGWDIYGHNGTEPEICTGYVPGNPATYFDPVTFEYCPDHGKPFPVLLPSVENITAGLWYSGSPYLGAAGFLPPGEGGFNPNAAFIYMWHSHNENEIVNFNVFPGGMLTMAAVEKRCDPGDPVCVPLGPLD